MDKDYIPSTKFSQETIDSYDIPYIYQDFCVNEEVEFVKCMRENPRIIENSFVHSVPFSSLFSRCSTLKKVWKKCQEYRERQIYEEMRKIYLEKIKLE
mmetsp:Transcript_8449/g.9547  ORF Transcript_8449/g.9547 Transcript_8449/m.9547 type:complete len:98 (+) Transcript_8449:42-335(+)